MHQIDWTNLVAPCRELLVLAPSGALFMIFWISTRNRWTEMLGGRISIQFDMQKITLHGESWHGSWQGPFWSISPANPFKYSFSLPLPSNTLFCRHFPPFKDPYKQSSLFHTVTLIWGLPALFVVPPDPPPFKDACHKTTFVATHLPHLWAYLPPPSKTLTKKSTFWHPTHSLFKDPCKLFCFLS